MEPGEKGELFFQDGADGEDRLYSWVLGWFGSDVGWANPGMVASELGAGVRAPEIEQSMSNSDTAIASSLDLEIHEISEPRTVGKTDGEYRLTLTEYSATPKGTQPAASKKDAQ